MQFTDIGQIRKAFGIDTESTAEVKREIKKRMKDIHPDNHHGTNHGDFKTTKDEETFESLKEALAFINSDNSQTQALVPVREFNELVRIVRDLVPRTAILDSERKLSEVIDYHLSSLKIRHRFPKITATIASAILTAVWLFPNSLSDHKVLSKYINADNAVFQAVWLYFVITTCALWLYLTMQEHREEEVNKHLKLETVQNQIFSDFLRFQEHIAEESKKRVATFTKEDFMGHLMEHRGVDNPISGLKYEKMGSVIGMVISKTYRTGRVDAELAQSLADLVFQRAIDKGIIHKETGKTISDSYKYEVANQAL